LKASSKTFHLRMNHSLHCPVDFLSALAQPTTILICTTEIGSADDLSQTLGRPHKAVQPPNITLGTHKSAFQAETA
jgi:hypothetical protein